MHTSEVLNGRSIIALDDKLRPSTLASRASVTTQNETMFLGSVITQHQAIVISYRKTLAV